MSVTTRFVDIGPLILERRRVPPMTVDGEEASASTIWTLCLALTPRTSVQLLVVRFDRA